MSGMETRRREWAIFGGPTCYFGNGEAEADTGVGDGHDGRHNGEPPDLVEIRDLRQNNLYAREDGHVGGVGLPARGVVAVPVEAVRPFHGPEHMQVSEVRRNPSVDSHGDVRLGKAKLITPC